MSFLLHHIKHISKITEILSHRNHKSCPHDSMVLIYHFKLHSHISKLAYIPFLNIFWLPRYSLVFSATKMCVPLLIQI